MTEAIGFFGVGLMGHGMAKNIMAKGYDLTILGHRNREPVDDLVALGASEAGSVVDLAKASDIVFLCLPGSPQVEAVVSNLVKGLPDGAIIVDCSTSDPVSTLKLGETLEGKGFHLVDAPLGGTPIQAEAGKLTALIGATDVVFNRLKPVVDAWAETVVHVGGPGDGHKMKLLNNFLSLGYAALYSEALALGEKVGISTQVFDNAIRGSRMDCGFYQTFMGYALEGNRESHKFTLTNALKDLRYLESMADAAGMANPIGNAAKNSFAMACSAGGDGDQDYIPHLVDFVAKRNGVTRT
ncbi:NAD(P)-dependent oxidoreductase [uncultured Pelagimonas sp.]|uniref:NAD(P)-dependent oxidoreductase n=1 Tax=uncultured Pelagimonas sp. TaxID=1618102 RepID=UPI002633B44D|nr:NAD(P)-dependent oxidoreductase [uncultured Pelagimonas sp.]